MDKRENGVTIAADDAEHEVEIDTHAEEEEEERPEVIEVEIEEIRSDVGTLLTELDRRRHEATDVRLQLRSHPLIVAALSAAALLTLASIVRWAVYQLRTEPPRTRARKIADAMAIIAKDPDRLLNAIEHHPDARRSLLAALAGVAGSAGKQMVKRAIPSP